MWSEVNSNYWSSEVRRRPIEENVKVKRTYWQYVRELSTDPTQSKGTASIRRAVSRELVSVLEPLASKCRTEHAKDEVLQTPPNQNSKASILAKLNGVKKLAVIALSYVLLALPAFGQGPRIDPPMEPQATPTANSNPGVFAANTRISGISSAAANVNDVTETSNGLKPASDPTSVSTTCASNGLISVITHGCYPTIGAALHALGSAPGTIVVPPGTWITSNTLMMNGNGQHILCAGIGATIISYTGGPTTAIFDVGTSAAGDPGYVNISINGCTISGNANVQYAIRTRGIHHSDFSHNSLINVTTAGIQVNYGVALTLDDLHTSFIEQAFSVQPQSCMILDGPDINHRTTASTVKVPICEGVSGTGIVLNSTADIHILNGTSEQNNKGMTISIDSQNAVVDGTDFELNSISDIENSGNQTRLTMISSLNLTEITSSAYYARLDGGLYNSITIDSGALDSHLEKLSYNNYGTGALTDQGTQTSKFRVVNLAGGGVYDPDINPENLSLAGITNNTGIQAFNTATSCTTAATAGATCTTPAIMLPVAYPDLNYRLACTGLSPTNVPALQTVTKSNTTFTITIVAITAAAATYGSYDCTAIHN
jgi:hypothetical protein